MFFKPCLYWCLILIHLWCHIQADFNLSDHQLKGIFQWKYEKRPFCNAFTGCGKKRTSSDPPYPIVKRRNMGLELPNKSITTALDNVEHNAKYTNNDDNANDSEDYMYEGLADLFDVNAEPAVENVQNKIMSNAKIYEAIKEASKEILRQKNKQRLRNWQKQQLQQNQQQQEQQLQ